ncbi:MAG: hypothetical protein WBD56_17395 [Anaerolineales bacterium]
MNNKTKIVLIVLLLLLSTLACSIFEREDGRFSGNRSISTNTSKSTFTDKTKNEVIEIEVKPDMRTNILKINNIELDEGEIILRLVTPEDEIIKAEVLAAPEKFNERFDLEIIPGLWKLELEMHKASGSYNIKWEAKN